jgi:hypothetical protein
MVSILVFVDLAREFHQAIRIDNKEDVSIHFSWALLSIKKGYSIGRTRI